MRNIKVKIGTDDTCNNYIYLFECSAGKSNLLKEGYEYCFQFNISDPERIDSSVLNKFKRQAIYLFEHNQHFLSKDIKMGLDDPDYEERNKWSVVITYETKDIHLTATKKGLTCINIDVKFPDYDELPF